MVRFENRIWLAIAGVSWACGPGINVDPPDSKGEPDKTDVAGHEPDSGAPLPLPGTSNTPAGAPDAASTPQPGESSGVDASAPASSATDTEPSSPPSGSNEPSPVDSGAGATSDTGPVSSQPAPTQSDPSGMELVPPMVSSTPNPQCSEDPRIADQQACRISSITQDEYLTIDLGADLELYSAEELWVSPVSEKPAWLEISLGLTPGKRLELQVDWTKPIPNFDQVMIRIARGEGRCGVVDVPVTFSLEGTSNECERVQELK